MIRSFKNNTVELLKYSEVLKFKWKSEKWQIPHCVVSLFFFSSILPETSQCPLSPRGKEKLQEDIKKLWWNSSERGKESISPVLAITCTHTGETSTYYSNPLKLGMKHLNRIVLFLQCFSSLTTNVTYSYVRIKINHSQRNQQNNCWQCTFLQTADIFKLCMSFFNNLTFL